MEMSRTGDRVVLTGVDMPMGDLVVLLIRITIAAIPAMVILYTIIFTISLIVMVLMGGLGMFAGSMGF